MELRGDLAAAHERSVRHIVASGARLDGETRLRIAQVAADAYLDAEPPPPWARTHGDPALDVAARLSRHAGTLTREWYDSMLSEGLDPLEWVEVVGVVVATVPVVAFARAAGVAPPVWPQPDAAPVTGKVATELSRATLNWVPVAAPADQVASVVQALSALPDEFDNLWRLAAAQYMSDAQMADPGWNRGTLSRPQMELIAGRISALRECFF